MKMGKYLCLLMILLACSKLAKGQDSLANAERKVKVLPLPAFGYAPETRTYLGAVSLFTIDLNNDSLTRTSNAKIEFNYTWNHQVILEMEWNYFFRLEEWFTKGQLHFSEYPDLYYGIGAQTTQADEQSFDGKRIVMNGEVLKRLANKLYLGIGLRYLNYQIEKEDDPRLVSNQTAGGSLRIVRDARNNILTPSKGHYLSIMNSNNWSGVYYNQLELDGRKYFSFGARKNTIALRFYQFSVFGAAPFYDLASIGGDRIIRGYRFGRFRADHLTNVQFEYRTPIWWRIGFAGFAGSGLIYQPSEKIGAENVKPNLGIGLRFLVDKEERTSLRFDYAVGKQGQNGFYISFGESF